jgi:hypothetical protein
MVRDVDGGTLSGMPNRRKFGLETKAISGTLATVGLSCRSLNGRSATRRSGAGNPEPG